MKILAAIISCLLLIGAAVGISVAAEETAPEIEYKNLAYEGAVQIVYYVNTATVPEGYTVKLATWTDGEEPVIKSAETFTKFVGETEYTIFTSEGVAPKEMRDTVYAQTILCNSEDGEVDRGEVVEYSIYTYVKNRVAKGSTADQKALYHALVDYGASVQKVLNHNTDKLANDMFYNYSTLPTQAAGTGTFDVTGTDGKVYTVEWYNKGAAGPDLVNDTYEWNKVLTIKSITLNEDGTSHNSVTTESKTYTVGDTVAKTASTYGSGATFTIAPFDGGVTTSKLIYIYDTNLTINNKDFVFGEWSGIEIRIQANGATGISAANSKVSLGFLNQSQTAVNGGANANEIRTAIIGGQSLGGSQISTGISWGDTFNFRIEVWQSETVGKVDVKLLINGVQSGKTVTVDEFVPTGVRFDYASNARNVEATFADTTCVSYTYFNEILGTNAVDFTANTTNTTTEKETQIGGYNVTYDFKNYKYWDAATQSFVLGRGLYVTNIDGADSVTAGGGTLTVGSAIPKGVVTNYTEPTVNIVAAEAGMSVDGSIFQFVTDMVVDSTFTSFNTNENHIMVKMNNKESNGAFEFYIANKNGVVYINGVNSGVSTGEKFELVLRGYEASGSYNIKIYVNKVYVSTKTIAEKPTSVGFKGYSNTMDMKLVFSNTYCDSYYIPYEGIGGVNKVDYSKLTTTAEEIRTNYLTVTDSGVSVTTQENHSHTIVWRYKSAIGPNADNTAWTFSKSIVIESLTDESGETSITVGSANYSKGSVIPKDWIGSTFNGDVGATPLISAASAGTREDNLRFVFDTDAVITTKYNTTNQIKVKIQNRSDNIYWSPSDYWLGTSGGYVTVNGTATAVKVGQQFNLRIEVYESESAGQVDIKFIVNGATVVEKTEYLRNSSGTGSLTSVAPTHIYLEAISGTRDVFFTISDTYCDKYTAAAE